MRGLCCGLLLGGVLTAAAVPVNEGPARGIWFWQEGVGVTHGSIEVVGNAALEDSMITFLKGHKIAKVYGSYGNRPATPGEAEVIAAWNAKLDAEGIESQILMSQTSWFFPENHAAATATIVERLVDFNDGRPAAERFDGLHLDIEPQAYKDWHDEIDNDNGWEDLDGVGKRDYLLMLGQFYNAVRAALDAEGSPGFPIWADVPVWYDSLTSSVGWDDAAQRDLWWSEAETALTGFVIMAFENPSFSSINSQTSWERDNVTEADLRYALRAKIGSGSSDDWATIGDFFLMRDQIEDAYGYDHGLDIQDYRDYRLATVSLPALEVAAELALPSGGVSPPILELHAAPQSIYVVFQSQDLCVWKALKSVVPQRGGLERVPLDGVSPRGGYFRVQGFRAPGGEPPR